MRSPHTGMPIPEWYRRVALVSALDDIEEVPADQSRVVPNQRARAAVHGDRAFCVLAEGQARHPEGRRLLLHPSGIGQDNPSRGHQPEVLAVAERISRDNAGPTQRLGEAGGLDPGPGAGMDREDEWQGTRQLNEEPQ